ncbi:MAG: alpha/beta hydrolase [Prosthecobacter sp.]|jgi:acetyl esterase/lipase|uniref:alpha/beta hydrolase n=1 Tax=Prosthecobacter sp. TaxID=1965333 RepID=UPI0019FA9D5A|nr:alpha/beta hydrolase [Prosthecobacter sp.]MBE2284262.1 alpha/beta hydrolase [Prosthecobacter sp.]
MNKLSLFAAALFLASIAQAEPAKVKLWPDGAPLAKGNEDKDQPFVYVWPAAKEKANGAAFVVCPGGGYGGLAADHEGVQVAKWFNGIGVSAFVLHYRLGTNGYHFPTQLIDVQRAIRHVRANAKQYGIDPERIGIIGFSAGGHLTSMAATMFDEKPAGMSSDAVDQASARPTVAAPTYPVISMIEDYGHKGSRKNLLGPNDNDELAKHTSTELRVTANTPPIFIFHTDDDTVVPGENPVAFYLACRKHKVPAELHIYKPGPHGVGLYLGDPVLGTWSGHLRDWLRNQGFLKPAKRTAINGKVTVNGTPVSWGSVIFTPEDPGAPVACARVMRGNFKLDEKTGPVVGKVKLTISYSAADVPGLETADGTVATKEQQPGASDWTFDVVEGAKDVELTVTR